MRGLCDAIDHKVLLPLQNPKIQVVDEAGVVRVAYEGKPRYVFPAADCALLPITNTTVEMLAEMLAGQLEQELQRLGAKGLTAIEMEVEENIGQAATYRVTLG